MQDIPTPFEVAEQQLDMAIELFFYGKSTAAIHTLACAAHEIFDIECAQKGLERGVVAEALKYIPKEKQKEVHDQIYAMKNYFKHGRFSRGVKPTWNPELSSLFILDACSLYYRLTGEHSKNVVIFSVWYRMNYPEAFLKGNAEFDAILEDVKKAFEGVNKKDYYAIALQTPVIESFRGHSPIL